MMNHYDNLSEIKEHADRELSKAKLFILMTLDENDKVNMVVNGDNHQMAEMIATLVLHDDEEISELWQMVGEIVGKHLGE